MNLLVRTFTAFPGTLPTGGDRHYMELNVSMSRAQIEHAIVTLLGSLTDADALHLLRSEFPQLFAEEAA